MKPVASEELDVTDGAVSVLAKVKLDGKTEWVQCEAIAAHGVSRCSNSARYCVLIWKREPIPICGHHKVVVERQRRLFVVKWDPAAPPAAKGPMRPSEIYLIVPPLVGTMKRSERELAAAMIVRTCHVLGDTFAPVTPDAINSVLAADVAGGVSPWVEIAGNPFLRADFNDLVAKGYAKHFEESGAYALTEEGLSAIGRWRMLPPKAECPADPGEPRKGQKP